jgi:hypothetical protein
MKKGRKRPRDGRKRGSPRGAALKAIRTTKAGNTNRSDDYNTNNEIISENDDL